MDDMEIRMFVRDRDTTFTNAVLHDDWDGVRAYCKHYGMKLPQNEKVMKAGIYKAVQECTNIPKDVKVLAAEKCVSLGFKPTIGGF